MFVCMGVCSCIGHPWLGIREPGGGVAAAALGFGRVFRGWRLPAYRGAFIVLGYESSEVLFAGFVLWVGVGVCVRGGAQWVGAVGGFGQL